MSRTFTEEEISELKESGFAASGTSRSRILSVLDLLVRFTDERTGISASEIARVIGICSEKPTSENAILKDLHQISESMPMGIRVAIPGHGENVGFRAVNKPLSSEEAILISDVLGELLHRRGAERRNLLEGACILFRLRRRRKRGDRVRRPQGRQGH